MRKREQCFDVFLGYWIADMFMIQDKRDFRERMGPHR